MCEEAQGAELLLRQPPRVPSPLGIQKARALGGLNIPRHGKHRQSIAETEQLALSDPPELPVIPHESDPPAMLLRHSRITLNVHGYGCGLTYIGFFRGAYGHLQLPEKRLLDTEFLARRRAFMLAGRNWDPIRVGWRAVDFCSNSIGCVIWTKPILTAALAAFSLTSYLPIEV